jgi:hypothetical protein
MRKQRGKLMGWSCSKKERPIVPNVPIVLNFWNFRSDAYFHSRTHPEQERKQREELFQKIGLIMFLMFLNVPNIRNIRNNKTAVRTFLTKSCVLMGRSCSKKERPN